MSYEKQTWANGDVITANKLNHMEDGIANADGGSNAPLICVYDSDNSHIDKKIGEIKGALDAGQNVFYNNNPDGIEYYILQQFSINIDEFSGKYTAGINFGNSEFTTESADTLEALLDEYPIYY